MLYSVLTLGRDVGAPDEEGDGVSFAEKMADLTEKLAEQFGKAAELELEIRGNLKGTGHEF